MNDLDALLDPLRDGAEQSGDLTRLQAERLTARVVASIDTLIETLPRLYEGRGWLALGFASWEDYCRGRLRGIVFSRTDRPAVVSALSGEGMSNRAVAAALDIDEGTVRNAKKKAAQAGAENSAPDRVRGADGKTYPATTKPEPEHEPEPEPLLTAKEKAAATRERKTEEAERVAQRQKGNPIMNSQHLEQVPWQSVGAFAGEAIHDSEDPDAEDERLEAVMSFDEIDPDWLITLYTRTLHEVRAANCLGCREVMIRITMLLEDLEAGAYHGGDPRRGA